MFDAGLTGLALMCFLHAGLTPNSDWAFSDTATSRSYASGDVVKRAIHWLVGKQKQDGSFTGDRSFMYVEALATKAMCEAYGATKEALLKKVAERGLAFLQGAQRPSPVGPGLWGWRYASRQEIEQFHRGNKSSAADLKKDLDDADTSVTSWCIAALNAGVLAGVKVNNKSLDGGLAFAKFVSEIGPDGQPTGLVGYLDSKGAGLKVLGPEDRYTYHPASMSALGMCIRIFTV